jgi:hypothetical protein
MTNGCMSIEWTSMASKHIYLNVLLILQI